MENEIDHSATTPQRLGVVKGSTCRIEAALCVLLACAGAAAPSSAQRPFEPRVEVGVAAQLAYAFDGSRCETHGDLIQCTNLGFLVVEVAPHARLSPYFSLGALAQVGLGGSTTLLGLALEGRAHPLAVSTADAWIGLAAGAVLLLDQFDKQEGGPSVSSNRTLPALHGGVGVEVAVHRNVSLGILSRLSWLPEFEHTRSSAREPEYGTQLLVSVGLSVTLRFE